MKKILTALAALSFAAQAAYAHDFWIEPETFQLSEPGAANVSFKVGHGEDQSAWPARTHRIIGLRTLSPEGLVDHQGNLGQVPFDAAKPVTLNTPGLHVLFFESTNSFSALPAEDFNAYAEEEGIRPILAHRAATDTLDTEGRELYSRRGKALLQVGDVAGETPDYMFKPVGMTLEIVPMSDPFRRADDEAFAFAVHYKGKPLPGATIHITRLDDPDTTMTTTTDAEGNARFNPGADGRWLLHTVWSETAPDLLKDATYSTVFSSLTFELSGK